MSKDNQERFDAIASRFDKRPGRTEMSAAIAGALGKLIGNDHPRVLDFGCGTGSCSLPVAAQCASVTGVDISLEMLNQYQAKAQLEGHRNVHILHGDNKGDVLGDRRFDLILCAMTMHHIEDIPALLDMFTRHLEKGGRLALADLDEEDGSFHGDMGGVYHHGISRNGLRKELEQRGYRNVSFTTVFTLRKEGADGKEHDYPIFFMSADR